MRTTSAAVLAAFIAGCSSSEGSDGGVQYEKPQIVPDNNPVCISNRVVEVGKSVSQPVLIQNAGKETLMISSATIAMDVRSHFSFQGPDIDEITSREFASVLLQYSPLVPGWDAIALQIFSNAENYPRLDIYVLALAQPEGLDGGAWDAGPPPAVAAMSPCLQSDR